MLSSRASATSRVRIWLITGLSPLGLTLQTALSAAFNSTITPVPPMISVTKLMMVATGPLPLCFVRTSISWIVLAMSWPTTLCKVSTISPRAASVPRKNAATAITSTSRGEMAKTV